MRLVELFVIGTGSGGEKSPSPPRTAGAFTAPQSVVTFPLATSIVATIARAARTILQTDFDSVMAPFLGALLVGTVIFVITVSDGRARPEGRRGWLAAMAVAALNCLVLFAAALGIEKF